MQLIATTMPTSNCDWAPLVEALSEKMDLAAVSDLARGARNQSRQDRVSELLEASAVIPGPAAATVTDSARGRDSPSRSTRRGLDWLNFFLADVQTGVGPFLAIYLAGYTWNEARVGLALTVELPGLTGPTSNDALVPLERDVPIKTLQVAVSVYVPAVAILHPAKA